MYSEDYYGESSSDVCENINDYWYGDWSDCYSDWIWEECSELYYYSDYCTGDCGWWYWDDSNYEDYWVSCDDFDTWTYC